MREYKTYHMEQGAYGTYHDHAIQHLTIGISAPSLIYFDYLA